MSSSPPTDLAASRPARWNPAGWPLRTRLVAIMVGLLVLLGLVVGAAAEIYLHRTLYQQVDAKLIETNGRNRPPPLNGGGGYYRGDRPPPGSETGWIVLRLDTAGQVLGDGGIVRLSQSSEGYTDLGFSDLPGSTVAQLAAEVPDNRPRDLDLGGDLGDYRIVSSINATGGVSVTAIPLASTQATLLQVALVTGGAVLAALLIAGWAGAVIIRRTLQPLSRVAATATKVSELELDRGKVDLAQRVPAADTDPRTEVGAVGAALNRMLDHVGNALEARHASETQVRQFVADASHELRTPLAAIRGYAELSRRSRQPVPEEIGHVLRRVESEATRMTALVEDLLLLARLDAGRPLAHDPVDLTMLVVDAVSDAHAAGPRHDWQLDLPEEPVTITGDGQRLHQVLANLLANARTHTPEGTTVTVGVGQDGNTALLSVTDEGPGIPEELQPHIFERFARGDSSRSRAAGSTGLGLSIVHAVVTAHGGTVSMHSAPGRTEFIVRLPMTASVAKQPEFVTR
ncbi:sensor histidine kinase [Actinoplanes friuliensis]|uniref:histidine kinase n=1 Tax=Actinoplanes friuliensis DSM 7358 TaxID=1246995 RepID=U5VQL6_9ACTN|nr:HAMP domain-containing sensor histidine kinase [Actinoplanes friuliensis]AGZ39077.1 putative two-component system sensor kinase [Actinoplanes friuliensis DSM 7358]